MVILFAQVAQPYVAQQWRGIVHQRIGALAVAQVSLIAQDTTLQIGRIGAALYHAFFVVGFNHQILGFGHGLCHLGGDVAAIGDEAEGYALGLNLIAYAVRAVMAHLEGSNHKIADLCRLALIDGVLVFGGQFAGNAVITVDAHVYHFCGVDGFVVVVGQMANGFDMVGVVVGNEYGIDVVQGKTVFFERLLQRSYANAGIYQDAGIAVLQKITISATATAQA